MVEEILRKYGINKEEREKIINSYPLIRVKDETFANNIERNFKFFESLGYKKSDIIRIFVSCLPVASLSSSAMCASYFATCCKTFFP